MADLAQNTSYGGQSLDSRYQAARKAIAQAYANVRAGKSIQQPAQAPAQQPPTVWKGTQPQSVNWAPTERPVFGIPYANAQKDQNFPQYQAPQEYVNPLTGEKKTSYVPPGYPTAAGEEGKFVSPSAFENLRIRNAPESIGGQYMVDLGQPGKTVRSLRGVNPSFYDGGKYEYPDPSNPQKYSAISGSTKLNKWGDQIDHIIPLWLGGADTDANKQVLNKFEHAKKTKIQAVPLTLLSAGLIDENEAKRLAFRWRDWEPTSQMVPETSDGFIKDANGNLDIDKAMKIRQMWNDQDEERQKNPYGSIGNQIKSWWNELKNIKDSTNAWAIGSKNFGDFGEGSKGVPAAIAREFVKGGASGLTAGYVPYELDDDYNSNAAKYAGMAAGVAGNLAGFLLSFAKFAKLTSITGNAVARALKIPGAQLPLALTTKLPGAPSAVAKMFGNLTSGQKFWNIAKNAGLLTTYGQLSREGIVGQAVSGEETDWGKRFIFDAATAGMIGKFNNPGISDALKVTGLTTALDVMLNYDQPDIQRSLTNGVLMGGLHYAAGRGAVQPFGLKPDQASAVSLFNKKIASLMGGRKPGLNVTYLEDEAAKIAQETAKKLANPEKVKEMLETRPFDDIVMQKAAIVMENRNAYIRSLGLAPEQEAKLLADDFNSFIDYLNKTEPIKDRLMFAIRDSKYTAPEQGSITKSTEVLPGELRLIARGTQGNAENTKNIDTVVNSLKNGENVDFYAVKRSAQDGVAMNELTGRKTENPENFIEFYAVIWSKNGTPSLLKVGTAPTKKGLSEFNTKASELNKDLPALTDSKDELAARMKEMNTDILPMRYEWIRGGSKNYIGAGPDVVIPPGETASAVFRVKTDSIDDGIKALNDAYYNRYAQKQINEDLPTSTIDSLRRNEVMTDWILTNVKEVQKIIESNPEAQSVIKQLTTRYGGGSQTPIIDETIAQKILDPKGNFTIKDLLEQIVFKDPRSSIFGTVGRYTNEKAVSSNPVIQKQWKEFMNTKVNTFGSFEREATKIEQMLNSQSAAPTGAQKAPPPPPPKQEELPLPGGRKAVTLGGEDLGEPIAPPTRAAGKKERAKKALKKGSPVVTKTAPSTTQDEALAKAVTTIKTLKKGEEVDGSVPSWVKDNTESIGKAYEKSGIPERVEELAMQRKTAKEIAKELGISVEDVQYIRMNRGIPSQTIVQGMGNNQQPNPAFEAWLKNKSKSNKGKIDTAETAAMTKEATTPKPAGSARRTTTNTGKSANVEELAADLETVITDALNTKIMSISEKTISNRESLYRTIRNILSSINIRPPKAIEGDFNAVQRWNEIQKQVKNTVSEKFTQSSSPTKEDAQNVFWSQKRTSTLNPAYGIDKGFYRPRFKKKSPTEAEKKAKEEQRASTNIENARDASKKFYASIARRAEAAKQKKPEDLDFMDGFSMYVTEVAPKIEGGNTDWALWKSFLKGMKTQATTVEGKPMSQSAAFIKKSLLEEEMTGGLPSSKKEQGLLAKIAEQRKASDEKTKITEEDIRTYGEGIKDKRLSKSRDQDYEDLNETEFANREFAAFIREGLGTFRTGIAAGQRVAYKMRKGKKGGRYVNFQQVANELLKKYDPEGGKAKSVEAAMERFKRIKELQDQEETRKIREWQESKKSGQ